ncbi:hypothetical protein BZA70DRAFT_261153 [Myxozyma melibiosi]|uniref:Carrier domain-containing protein n=1 Tax=Myxozyma melibiosi TaxID=54550 RepID=A0ABR1EYX3_9ASCO
MEEITPTPFPSLMHTTQITDHAFSSNELSHSFQCEADIIRAWGNLLVRYTLESSVVFTYVEKSKTYVVVYDSESADYTLHPAPDAYSISRSGTTVAFDVDHYLPPDCDIVAAFSSSGNVTLVCRRSLIPDDFVGEMGSQLLRDKNTTAGVLNFPSRELPGPGTLHNLSQFSSSSIALEFLNESGEITRISYEELSALSAKVARKLVKFEASVVPLMIPQSVEMYIAVLGILRAGKAFCPLSAFDTPKERISFVVRDTAADVILVTNETESLVRGIDVSTIAVNDELLTDRKDDTPYQDKVVDGDSIAYCMFTSGSTGTPKGVLVSHKNACQALLAHSFVPHFKKFLNFASLTFDVSVLEIFLPWFRGATLVSASRSLLLTDLSDVILKLNVDACELTPTVASLLSYETHNSLKIVMTIGEKLTRDVIDKLGGARILYNTYGPTEAAIQCTAATEGTCRDFYESDIGVPLTTTTILICDSSIQDRIDCLPVGWRGELVIAGVQVSKGYLNRPDLTAKAFMHHSKYGLCYRTGDLARVLPNGRIAFAGRIAEGQVKVRGRRIELGEIEYACRVPAVALVLNSQLVVAVESESITARENCEKFLPGYMLPDYYFVVEKIPLLESGKTNRKLVKAIAEREFAQNLQQTADVEYANEAESAIAKSIHSILGVSPGPEVSFRSIGLDSIHAMRLAALLKQSFTEKRFRVVDILLADSIRSLTNTFLHHLSEEIRPMDNLLQSYSDVPQGVTGVYEVTPLQLGMLFEWSRDHRLYSNRITVRIRNVSGQAAIIKAFRYLIDKHEILRTGFLEVQDGRMFVQIVYRDSSFQVFDGPESDRFERVDLPPLQISLRSGSSDQECLADIMIHHVLYDGWAFDKLLGELERALKDPELKRVSSSQFRHAVPLLYRSEGSIDFWKNYLDGASVSTLPKLIPPGSEIATPFAKKAHLLLSTPFSDIQNFSKKYRVSPQSIFHLAWAQVLRILQAESDASDVVFGTVISRRAQLVEAGLEDALGPMINTLPLRVPLTAPIIDTLRELTDASLRIMQHADVSLADVGKTMGSHANAFHTLVVWQQSDKTKSDMVHIIDSLDHLEFELLVEFEPQFGTGLVNGSITFHTDQIASTQAESILKLINEYIQQLTRDESSLKLTLEQLTVDDSLLSVRNPTPVSFNPGCLSAIDLVGFDSGKMAIEIVNDHGYESVTYDQLRSAYQSYASMLRQCGIDKGDYVGVVLPKSIELYVVVLAIWSMGAVYVPVDPSTPVDRINIVMSSAGAKLCLISKTLETLSIRNSKVVVSYQNIKKPSEMLAPVKISPNDVAYVIFTSGSTGTPKGVVVPHDCVVNNILLLSQYYPAPSRDSKMLQLCSISFDVSIFEVLYAFHNNMTLVSAPNSVILPQLSKVIHERKITHLSMTPTVGSLLEKDFMGGVELVIFAGEAINPSTIEFWRGLPAVVANSYGPTEMTNVCNGLLGLTPKDDFRNIGKSFANTSCFILDPESTKILPIGSVGELAFGGYQVTAGYLHAPELSREKFIHLGKDYGRVYRTGDRARMLADGSILYLGRLDSQVKIAGQRVELGEINSAVLQTSGVLESASTVMDGRIVVFVQSSQEASALEAKIRRSLELRLPVYMQPWTIAIVPKFPITTNGKTDLKKLSLFMENGNKRTVDFPRDELVVVSGSENERLLAEVLVQLIKGLTLEEIRKTKSLFYYGLDSVLAVKLINLLLQRGFLLSIGDIRRDTVVTELAAKLRSAKLNDGPSEREMLYKFSKFAEDVEPFITSHGIDVSSVECTLPVTSMQDMLLGSQKSYLSSFVLKLSSPDHTELIKNAWAVMPSHREMLRTCFIPIGANSYNCSFAQVILRESGVDFGRHWHEKMLRHPSDYPLGEIAFEDMSVPPYRITELKCDNGTYLAMEFHHALFDLHALNLLLNDVWQLITLGKVDPRPSYLSAIYAIHNVDTSAGVRHYSDLLLHYEPQEFPDLMQSCLSGRPNGRMSTIYRSTSSLAHVDAQCRGMAVSLSAAVYTSWAKLMALVCGSSDIVFGAITSGRASFPGCQDTIAPVFHSYPIRCNLKELQSNKDALQELEKQSTECSRYPFTPMRDVIKEYNRANDGNPNLRLYDTMVVIQSVLDSDDADGLNNSFWSYHSERDDNDMSVILEIRRNIKDDSIEFLASHDRSVLDVSQALHLLSILDCLLKNVVDHPTSSPSDLLGLASGQLSISSPASRIVTAKYLHSGFELNASQKQNKSALEFLQEDGSIRMWTYSQLNSWANKLSKYLSLEHGVTIEQSVPLCLPKSPEYYASLLAVLKSGAAFCPIDPATPSDRVAYMISELGASVILVDSGSRSAIEAAVAGSGLSVSIIDVSALNIDDLGSDNRVIDGYSDSATAYRIYTSGTTGKPKAVSVEVRNSVQTILASDALLPHHENSRLLQFASTTFDMSIYDCFIAWEYGLTLCAAQQSHVISDLESVINQLQITLLDLTPSVASTLRRSSVACVECLYCIGEALPQSVVDEWDGACVNSYGPTEAAMCCTITKTLKGTKSSIVGRSFGTTEFYVLDPESQRILPTYSVGELAIGGYQVAREYFKNPELSASKFIHLNSAENHPRVYRTGDLVRMLEGATVDFIGRKDDQVKLRGLRIELQEVNAVIREALSTSGLIDLKDICTVILGTSQPQLVSFISIGSPLDGCEIIQSGEDLSKALSLARTCCESFLPRYMVPSAFIPITTIPLSPAGKLSRKRLQGIYNDFVSRMVEDQLMPDNDMAELTETQQKLQQIFSDVSGLPVETVKLETSIYQLGMDSISATQISAAMRRAGLRATALDVLKCMNISKLSALVETSSELSDDTDVCSTFETSCRKMAWDDVSSDVKHIYPCTHTQEGILSQFQSSEGTLYFNYFVLSIPNSVEQERVRRAWARVYSKYDILRTGFKEIEVDGFAYAQLIYGTSDIRFASRVVDDISSYAPVTCDNYSKVALEHLNEPQVFLEYISERDGKSFLLFAANHAIFDANSLSMIMGEMEELCQPDFEPNGYSPEFKDTLNEILQLQKSSSSGSASFWRSLLSDAPVTRIPNLNPFVSERTVSAKLCTENVLSVSQKTLQDFSSKLDVSIQTICVAAWAKLLSLYVGETDVLFGLVLSGRTGLKSADSSVFPCLTTVPFRSTLDGSNEKYIRSVHQTATQILEFQHTPYSTIREASDSRGSLYDSVFLYQKTQSDSNRIKTWNYVLDKGTTEYSLSLELEPSMNGTYSARLSYDNSLVPTEQAALMLRQFESVLLDFLDHTQEICVHPHIPVDLSSVLLPRVTSIPTDVRFLHEFVERQAALDPSRTALEFATVIEEDELEVTRWSFRDIDREANKIANFLLTTFEVRPGDRIAVCFDKCPEASFAFVGILKAGCSFLALDPTSPIDRKGYICADAGVKCLLSSDSLLEALSTIKVPVISATSIDIVRSSPEAPLLKQDLLPENTAYCLYTSGSTGNPKGCMLSHENAVQGMLAFQQQFAGTWTSSSKFMQFASFHFDVSVLEQFWSWSVGIAVVSAPRDLILKDLPLSIRALGVTHIDLTPSLAVLVSPETAPSLCRGLFITGGDLLKQEVLDTWGDKGVIYNAYGPTEATIGVTMRQRAPRTIRPSNIGSQFSNVGSAVFYPGTEVPVPRGAIGELCVSGALVGDGYINQPDTTALCFMHSDLLGDKMYRTGDLVRLLSDDSFDFVGRKDTQVKLRGQRLEIGEINAVMKAPEEGIVDAVTLILKHPANHRDLLVSFIVVRDSEPIQGLLIASESVRHVLQTARDRCLSKLPNYMIPTYILPLSRIPLSVNNKVDVKALAKLYSDANMDEIAKYAESGGSGDEDWTDTEKRILAELESLDGIDKSTIDRNTTFFQCGLDSISMVPLLKKLRQVFPSIRLSALMQYPSIRLLASYLSSKSSEKSAQFTRESEEVNLLNYHDQASQTLDLATDDIEYILPCTSLQEGIIARAMSSETRIPMYLNRYRFNLFDEVDEARLQLCWNTVVSQNQALRACFLETADGVLQVILRDWKPFWIESSTDSDDIDGLVESSLIDHWSNIQLSRPPMILHLVRCSGSRLLTLSIFHALYDAVSLQQVLNDVVKLYFYLGVPKRPSFVEAVYRMQRSYDIAKAELFWTDMFSRLQMRPLLDNPVGDQRSTLLSFVSTFSYDVIKASARSLSCTPQVLFQAAFSLSLATLMGSVISFGVVVSGRSFQDSLDDVAGPLFNTLPVALDISGFESHRDMVKRLQDYSSSLTAFQHFPLRQIRKLVNVSNNQNLFDAVFVFQGDQESEFADSLWINEEIGEYTTDARNRLLFYPISFEVSPESTGKVKFNLGYLNRVLTSDGAREFQSQILQNLERLVSDPESTLGAYAQLPLSQSAIAQDRGELQSEELQMLERNQVDPDIVTAIRDEIAKIAGADPLNIDERKTVFQYGLDSIDGIRLSSALKKRGISMPLSTILKHPSALAMAQWHARLMHVESKPKDGARDFSIEEFLRDVTSLPDCEGAYYCTPLQDGIIFQALTTNNKLYVNQNVLLLDSGIDVARLQNSFEKVIQSNAIYRSVFITLDGLLPQPKSHYGLIVLRSNHLAWDSNWLSDENWDNEMKGLCDNAASAIDHFPAPPLSICIAQSETRRALVLTISHALYDGHSLGLFLDDVVNVYKSGASIERPHFAPLLSRVLGESQKASSIAFWNSAFAGFEIERFPKLSGQLTGSSEPSRGMSRSSLRSKLSLAQCLAFARERGTTLQTIAQVCWSILLSRYLGTNDVAFGTVLSGRTTEDDENVQFPSMVTVPTRVSVNGSFTSIIGRVHAFFNLARDYQYCPLIDIYKTAAEGHRLFDTLFIFQRPPPDESTIWTSIDGSSAVEYSVAVEFEQLPDGLRWSVAAQASEISSDDVGVLAAQLDGVLYSMVSETDSSDYLSESKFVGSKGRSTLSRADFNAVELPTEMKDFLSDLDSIKTILVVDHDGSVLPIGCAGELSLLKYDSQTPIRTGLRTRLLSSGKLLYLGMVSSILSYNGLSLDTNAISDVICGSSTEIFAAKTFILDSSLIVYAFLKSHDYSMISSIIFSALKSTFTYGKIPSYVIPIEPGNQTVNMEDTESMRRHFVSLDVQTRQKYHRDYIHSADSWSYIETKIREVLSRVSNISTEEISKDQSLFQMGLDSISCIQVSNLLRQEGLLISVSEIINCGNIRTISYRLGQLARESRSLMEPSEKTRDYSSLLSEDILGATGIDRSAIETVLPATSGQVYMLSGWQSSSRTLLFPTFCFGCADQIDEVRLLEAWKELVRTQPILRTTFVASQSEKHPVLQLILRAENADVCCSAGDTFDPDQDAVVGVVPVRLHYQSGKNPAIYLTIHHSLYDAWSLRMIVSRLSALYEGLAVPEFEGQVRDKFINGIISNENDNGKFWKAQMAAVPKISKVQLKTSRAELLRRNAVKHADSLTSFVKKNDITVSTLLLAAFSVIYNDEIVRNTTEPVAFGMYNSGRTVDCAGVLDLAFPTVNIHPLIVDTTGKALVTVAKTIQNSLREVSQGYRSQVALWQVKEWTGVDIDCAVNVLEGVSEIGGDGRGVFRQSDRTVGSVRREDDRFGRCVDGNRAQSSSILNLDVEFAFVDGRVDIGVFYHEGVLGDEMEGDAFIEKMAGLIDAELAQAA